MTNGELDTSRLDLSVLENLNEIKEKYGTRIHVSLGGYGRSDNFGAVVTNPQLLKGFIENLTAFAKDNNLDGIDFDWEFPKTATELNGYIELMSEVKKQGLIVSVVLYPSADLDILPYLIADRIHIMSYNRGVRHSTYDQAIEDLEYFQALGAPNEKLILGIPFYGRQMNDPWNYFTYSEIVKQYNPTEDADEAADIYFNGVKTVQEKSCYAQTNNFGGVMIWELGQDSEDDASLLQAIYQAVVSKCESLLNE